MKLPATKLAPAKLRNCVLQNGKDLASDSTI